MYYDEFGGEVMSPERIEEIRKAKEAEKAAAEAGTDVDPDEAGGAATEEEGKKKKKKK